MVKRGLTRDRLVAIAHRYVADNGLEALTMRRLAIAAEVTPGALYKHVRDRRDLQRAMSDAIYATIDFSDLELDRPTVAQVITCCERMRAAMLGFRDGGRIVAGSYSPFAATLKLSATLMRLVQGVALPEFEPGDLVAVLRSHTIGFVIDEQAYLELERSGEWESLLESLDDHGTRINAAGDIRSTVTGDRDRRFTAGLRAILAGTVRADVESMTGPPTT
ncbi:TetR/AcrR family transcriptional regulator [Nocardia sp. NBC_00511]|uniref:TetR/AcrR family transcriptional regulator n=1 Tax=Nocardia sp. NBC_00511 TaxID=2903591 RepID=UPI0030E2ACC6